MIDTIMQRLGVAESLYRGGDYIVTSPTDGTEIGRVQLEGRDQVQARIDRAQAAFESWRQVPAPRRGELVRLFGEQLRLHKEDLGALVTLECGKIYQEGLGEVQEMIDICDLAVGQSRQLYGLTIASERPGHHMRESWHPLGPIGLITAFNFPVAPWAWNAALALVCGNSLLWKPSEKTPLCALACQSLLERAMAEFGDEAPADLSQVVIGDREAGERLVDDPRIPLISATGSTRMGREVAPRVAARFGRSILELGGNNAIIGTPDADIKMTVIGAIFGAVGTCGQRCTSTRRLIIHESVYEKVKYALIEAYKQLRIGNPLDENNHVGPLIDQDALKPYQNALKQVVDEGGKIVVEGGILEGNGYESGCYVKPAVAEAEPHFEIVQQETFAPILYLLKYSGNLENAIAIQNGVVQGLSSAIMTNNLREAEYFLSVQGSDCGIANVNIGTSGAEIGGAFGGEKETGGGRESGSDAWKAYMRRQTNTINYTSELPLAQGIKFDL